MIDDIETVDDAESRRAQTAPLETGNHKVDEALAALDGLESLPLAEQAERLFAACDRLGAILEER